jgi:hypothetical protein
MQNPKKSKFKMMAAFVLVAGLGLAQTAMAQSDPSAATKTAAPAKPDSGKVLGCVLGPAKYGYNKQCSMTGG